jgi:hypothetical protein
MMSPSNHRCDTTADLTQANLKLRHLDLLHTIEQFRPGNDFGWKVMTFSRGLFQEAHNALSTNWPIALMFLAAQSLLDIFDEIRGGGGSAAQIIFYGPATQLVLCGILAVCIHQAVIKPGFVKPHLRHNSMMWGYVYRLAVMALVCAAAAFLLTFALVHRESSDAFIVLSATLAVIFYAWVLSMWGTVLPAVAVEGNVGFARGTARGKVTFRYSFLRLLFCCGPLLIIGLTLLSLFHWYFGETDESRIGEVTGVDYPALVSGLIASLFALFNTALASTILSRAYLIGEAKLSGTAA